MTSVAAKRSEWPVTLVSLSLILLWGGYCYWETLNSMIAIWQRSETYAHGFLVPIASIWMIWRERDGLKHYQPTPTSWLVLPVSILVFFWLLGELASVNALTQFSLVAILVLTTVSLLGTTVSKRILFPLIFLFLAVPIGDFMLPKLMEWTAGFTVTALRASGIPVYQDGTQFVIPSGNWSVVEACSGIRYIVASVTVGTLFAYLNYTSLKRRILFIVVACLVPIVANWIRAYLIVMLGHISGNKLAAGADHLIYGWIFFGIVISIMFAIGMRWSEPTHPTQPKKYIAPETKQNSIKRWMTTFVLALVIAAGPLYQIHIHPISDTSTIQLSPVGDSSTWHQVPSKIDWKPQFANPSADLQTAYDSPEGWIGVYIAYYKNQNKDIKLVTSTNELARSNDPFWQIVARSSATATLAGNERTVQQAELLHKQSNIDERFIIWQWYWINGHLTSSDIEAKWLTALAKLTGHGDDSAVVMIYSPKETAAISLPGFAKEMGAEILRRLAEASPK